MEADTHHDFQPACAVGVMRAVNTPWRGATRRIGNSLLGAKCLLHTVCLDIMVGNWLARLGITTVMFGHDTLDDCV